MADSGPKQPDTPADPTVFDVGKWLASLTGVDGWVVTHTRTRKTVKFVASYGAADGTTAQITFRALPVAGNASWELLAEWTGRQARVVIPARTRIKW